MAAFYGRYVLPAASGQLTLDNIVDGAGVDFTPAFWLIWTTGVPSAGYLNGAYLSTGYGTALGQQVRGHYANADNATIQFIGRHSVQFEQWSQSKCLWLRRHVSNLPNGDITVNDCSAAFNSVGSGQIVLDITQTANFLLAGSSGTQAYTAPDLTTEETIHLLAIGGTGVSAEIGHFLAPSSAGAQAQIVSGLGIAPQGLITLMPYATVDEFATYGSDLSGGRGSGYGLVSNLLVNHAPAGMSTGYYTGTTTYRRMYRNAAWHEQTLNRGTAYPIGLSGRVTAFTADGFEVFWDTLTSGWLNVRVPFLAFRGIPFWVGRLFHPTSIGLLQTLDPAFQADAILLQGAGFTATAAANAWPPPQPHRFCLGAATAAGDEGAGWFGDETNVNPTRAARGLITSRCYVSAVTQATGSATTPYAEANWSQALPLGFETNWPTVDGTAHEVIGAAWGEAGVTPPTPEGNAEACPIPATFPASFSASPADAHLTGCVIGEALATPVIDVPDPHNPDLPVQPPLPHFPPDTPPPVPESPPLPSEPPPLPPDPPPPSPPPPPPTPVTPLQIPIQYFYMWDDSLYGNYRDDIEGFTNVSQIWAYIGTDVAGSKAAWIVSSFVDAIARNRPISFGPDINPQDLTFTAAARASIDAAVPYWGSVSHVYVDELGLDKSGMEAYIATMNAYINSLGLPAKPVWMNFTRGQILGEAPLTPTTQGWRAANLNVVGIESYIDPAQQNASNVVAQLDADTRLQLTTIGRSRPTFLIAQSYDRSGAWTNLASLAAIQWVPYNLAREDRNIIGLWLFNYGRPGGTLTYTSTLTPIHQEIAALLTTL